MANNDKDYVPFKGRKHNYFEHDNYMDEYNKTKTKMLIKFMLLPFAVILLLCLAVIIGSCSSDKKVDKNEKVVKEEKSEKKEQSKKAEKKVAKPKVDPLTVPVRDAPEKFPRDTYLPKMKEGEASGGIKPQGFSAGRDLIYVDDPRVWWESDHDGDTDDECDHTMHKSMEEPFRRLVNLCEKAGWQLRVQETYRPDGIHATKSLHKEGRAIDITVDKEPKLTPFEKIAAYEELAKLAWQAGFDWVYYEYRRGSGPHVHASVKRER